MAWVSRTAVIAAALVLVATRGAAEFSYEPGERSDPWDRDSIYSDPHWLVDQRTGCWAYDSNAGASDTISWSGACPFGRADGRGTLTFYDRGRMFERLTGNFDAGMLEDGRVSIAWADGSRYDGEEKNGQFNGHGVLINSDGTRYDGMWRDDKFVDTDDHNGRNDEVAGASSSTEAKGANESAQRNDSAPGPDSDANHVAASAQTTVNNGLPPPDQIPFKMSTAPVKPPQAAPKPQRPAQAVAKQYPQAQPAPAPATSPAKWTFLIGKHPRLVTADGSKLNLNVTDGALARELKRADGSVAKDSLVFVSETSGAVRNERGDAVATFQVRNHGIAIDYSDGSTEIVSADSRGLKTMAQMNGGQTVETRWYPDGHKFSRAERRRAVKQLAMRLAAARLAAAKPERVVKPATHVAAPAQYAAKPEVRVAQAAPPPANEPPPPAPAARRAIQPRLKPDSIAAATDVPTPVFKPTLHIAARTHKRHVAVAAANPPAPSETPVHATQEPAPPVREAREPATETPKPVSPVHEAQAVVAPKSPAHHQSAHPAAAREVQTASDDDESSAREVATHSAPTLKPATHSAPAREQIATAHESKEHQVSAAPAHEPTQPPATRPAPVAQVASAVPSTPAPPPTARAITLITPTPALRVAAAVQSTPPPVRAATAAPSTPPPVRVALAAPAPAHAARSATPPIVHAAPTVPPAPVVHVATTALLTPPTVHLAAPSPGAPAVAHATTPPAPVPAVAHVTTPPAPVPAVAHAAPTQQAAAPAVHVASAMPPPTHTLLPQTSAPATHKRNGSECLSLVSNGTHWGFRNNCDNDIQFAYCIMNGTDRLTACGDSAVPGSVAGHGFTSLVADLTMKDGGANRSFRWVGCNGGAGEVVPRLDRADPPMGRCLHTSDLPQGAERADASKRLAK